jgi:uncharacterized protein YecE (DUF72 family)
MLDYYSTHLNGVEVNGSFYRTPPVTTLEKWRDGTPPGFLFCMKANRGLTYSADTFDRVGLAHLFSERISPMGERLGPVLLQFPPVRRRNVELLEDLLHSLARPAACEFRHESWFDPSVYDVIKRHAGALVVTDEEKWPQAPLVELGPFAYFRLRRGYSNRSLEAWIATVRSAAAAHQDVHVYFKHDPQAPRLALRMRHAIAGKTGPESRSPRPRPSAPRRAAPAEARTGSTDRSGRS